MCLLRNRGKKCRHAKKAHSEKENLRDRCWGQGGGLGGKKLMWGEDAASLCVRGRGRGGGRKWCSPCSSLSARRSWWLSRVEGTAGPQGALGTPSALHRARSPPSQHSPNTQALAIKTTPNKHTPNTLTTCGGWEWRERGKDTAVQQGSVSAAGASSCSAIFTDGGDRTTELYC